MNYLLFFTLLLSGTALLSLNIIVKAVLIILFSGAIIIAYTLKDKSMKKGVKAFLKAIIDGDDLDKTAFGFGGDIEEITIELQEKENRLKQSKEKVEDYKKELDLAYKNLLAKSTEVEFSNELLEKRIANLSNLNAIGKSVLSELDFEKIVSIILDTYFILTKTQKIAFYHWEQSGELVQKSVRGEIIEKSTYDDCSDKIIQMKNNKNGDEYLELAKSIREDGEIVIISELLSKQESIGAILIIEDEKNIVLGKDEIETISALGIYASIAIKNAKLYSEIVGKERMEKELSIASEIQRSLLPKKIKIAYGLEISDYFEPAKEVGGDYYDYFMSADDLFGISIGDVSGKGMPASLLMLLVRSVLKTLAGYDSKPDSVMTKLNQIIYEDINEEMFVTLFYSGFDKESKTLYFSNAGHNPLIWYSNKEGKILEKNIKGLAIGFAEDYNYKLGSIELEYEDVVVYYTDGITEAENSKKELFGMDRLKDVIEINREKSSPEIKEAILEAVNDFRQDYEQTDDITLVVIKFKG